MFFRCAIWLLLFLCFLNVHWLCRLAVLCRTAYYLLSEADAGILKRKGGGALRISDEGGPTMVGGDVSEKFEN